MIIILKYLIKIRRQKNKGLYEIYQWFAIAPLLNQNYLMHQVQINNGRVFRTTLNISTTTHTSNKYSFNRFPVKTSFQKYAYAKKLNKTILSSDQDCKLIESFDFNQIKQKIQWAERNQTHFCSKTKSSNKLKTSPYRNSKSKSKSKSKFQIVPDLVIEKQPLRFYTQQSVKKKIKPFNYFNEIGVVNRKNNSSLNLTVISKSLTLSQNPFKSIKTQQNYEQLYHHLTQIELQDKKQRVKAVNLDSKKKRTRNTSTQLKRTINRNLSTESRSKANVKVQKYVFDVSNRSQQRIKGWQVRNYNKDNEETPLFFSK